MKRVTIVYLVAAMAILGAQAFAQTARSTSSGNTPTRAARFGDQYQLLLDRNIFSKYRTRIDGSSRYSYRDRRDEYSSRLSRQQYVLTGIVKEDGAYRAFIEDTRTGVTTRYSVGQELGQGKISAIDVDSIKFNNGAENQSIEIGMSLDGKQASFVYIPTTLPSVAGATTNPTDAASAQPGMTASPTGAAPASSGGANDVIERMKRARLQEIKQ